MHARDRKGRRRVRDGSLARAALGGGGGRLPYRLRRPRRSRKDGGKAIRLRGREGARVKGEERLKIVTPDLLHGLRSTTKGTRIPVEEARHPFFLTLPFPVP